MNNFIAQAGALLLEQGWRRNGECIARQEERRGEGRKRKIRERSLSPQKKEGNAAAMMLKIGKERKRDGLQEAMGRKNEAWRGEGMGL